ncbi:drug resistance transporter, EmrB/QacA subfamily [Sulfobacillus acidophilus TPY]|uniref:Drug resistance transporter, EmrB/QacA subfamily n=1 Tax=Sulfobacillus acidophilus (strain ATCC 700253 / DSM 10332 / NAL) TaxID=679936 RepID=G8U1Q0_SULAD|nr:drug resistance transporter, EmrB/QacA subfamily [Sulfobacillus acidophilus TPY]AEW06978.1 drug resistance transporter, EmrB/QacA subfamily [Sulfobacillus acidophilus DSM 10332]
MRKWLVLGVVVLGLWMDLMDMTIVNVAIPAIQNDLGTSLQGVQYVVTSYLITIGVFEPITAYWADTQGMKRMYLASLAIFTVASALNGLAWSLPSLIAFRILQGIGGGMIMPLALSIVSVTFAPEERALALGLMGLPLLAAPALGPTIGGWFVQFHTWRDVFWINVPIGIVAFIAALRALQEFPTTRKPLDLGGFVLAAIGFASLLVALSNGPTAGWGSLEIVLLLQIAIFSLALFGLWEARHPSPLFDLRILRLRWYSSANVVTFFTMMGLFGVLYLLPVFLETVGGLGPMDTGMTLIPLVLSAAITIPLSGLLLPRLGAVGLTSLGLTVMGLGTAQLMHLGLSWDAGWLRLWVSVIGAGLGLGIMPAITVAYGSLPPAWMNQGSAMLNLMRQVGSALGVALYTTIIQMREPVYWTQLASTVTVTNFRAQARLAAWQQQGIAHGLSPAQAHVWALTMMAHQLQQTATLWAFHNAFGAAAVAAVIGIGPALWLWGSRQVLRPPDARHTALGEPGGVT